MSDNNSVSQYTNHGEYNLFYQSEPFLCSIMFLFLTLFVSMILQLATISYVSQCCVIQIIVLFNHEGTHYPWFTQPDILANDRGWGWVVSA